MVSQGNMGFGVVQTLLKSQVCGELAMALEEITESDSQILPCISLQGKFF